MAFNADEKNGLLTVEPHDEGWAGGPKLSARHQALVEWLAVPEMPLEAWAGPWRPDPVRRMYCSGIRE